MKVSRDKAFERLCKLEKGKVTGRLTTIRRRHEESKQISKELLNQYSEYQWTVASSDGSNEYTIHKATNKCEENGQLQCKDYNTCMMPSIYFPATAWMQSLTTQYVNRFISLLATTN